MRIFCFSLNMPAREQQNRDIQMENIGIARRLEKTKPVIRYNDMVKLHFYVCVCHYNTCSLTQYTSSHCVFKFT